eukprot:SAG31_NODE_183_length_20987_cov_8.711078_17_plen_84_part_00
MLLQTPLEVHALSLASVALLADLYALTVLGGHPETALCYNLRGVCYSWLNQHQKALEDADKAVQLRPSATVRMHPTPVTFLKL